MKKYEIVYIIHPDLEGNTSNITEKVKNILEKSGGKVLNEESWGKKKLAYEIDKNSFGVYEFLLVEMEPVSIKEVERVLRLSEEIIRSIVVQAGKEVEIKSRGKKAVKKVEILETKVVKEAKVPSEQGVAVPTPPKKDKLRVGKTKKTKAEKEKEEKERQKELDEKLQEIIGGEEGN